MSIGLLAGTAPAWAHVRVDADNAAPGTTSVLTFRVPGESENGALTTQLSVELPNVASARTEVMPGWTARLDRDAAAGTVQSVTWTAAPGTGISSDQFALFRISVKLPDTETVSFPATQTYSDGTVVRWDQAPLPGGGEPEYPAPVLTLTGTDAVRRRRSSHSSGGVGDGRQSARWLAGGALTVAAVAVAARGPRAAVMNRLVAAVVFAVGTRGGGARRWRASASAHATRIATDPAENTELTKAPAEVSATFNEALQPEFAAMTVVGPDGNLWSTGDPQVHGAVISVGVRPLGPAGTYTVNYRVTSADGHVVSGSWSFRSPRRAPALRVRRPAAATDTPDDEHPGVAVHRGRRR